MYDISDILRRLREHGYSGRPSSERVFRDCIGLQADGEDYDKLLTLASDLEAHEKKAVND